MALSRAARVRSLVARRSLPVWSTYAAMIPTRSASARSAPELRPPDRLRRAMPTIAGARDRGVLQCEHERAERWDLQSNRLRIAVEGRFLHVDGGTHPQSAASVTTVVGRHDESVAACARNADAILFARNGQEVQHDDDMLVPIVSGVRDHGVFLVREIDPREPGRDVIVPPQS